MTRTIKKSELTKTPNDIDKKIGERLRSARIEKGFSQMEMGEALGVSFQQIQKYEKGANRANPRVIIIWSKMCDKPITWFFDDSVEGLPTKRELVGVRLFMKLNSKQQKALVIMMRAVLADNSEESK